MASERSTLLRAESQLVLHAVLEAVGVQVGLLLHAQGESGVSEAVFDVAVAVLHEGQVQTIDIS